MNIHTKIIEGVRQFPTLYNNNVDLDERNQAWQILAKKLQMDDMHLKIRWYALMQAYQRDNNFKYAKQMRFVPRTMSTQTKVQNWPEFIITEEDLKEARTTTQDQEEFVFIDAEDKEYETKETKPQEDKEKLNTFEENVKKGNQLPKGNLTNKIESNDDCIKHKPIKEVVSVTTGVRNDEKTCSKIEESLTSKMEQEMAAVDVNKNTEVAEESVKECKQVAVEKCQSLASDRCEDMIFGELVTAMLKRMDENKKKNIKKEIMNLLLS